MTDTALADGAPFEPVPDDADVVLPGYVERNRRALLAAAAGVALLLVILVVVLLSGGSSTPSDTALPVVHHPAPLVVVTPPVTQVPLPLGAHLGRDPFKPLFVAPVAAVAVVGAPTATVVTAPRTTTTFTTGTTVTQGSTGTGTGTGTGTTATGTGGTGTGSSTAPAKTYPLKLTTVSRTTSGQLLGTFVVAGRTQLARPPTATSQGTVFGPTNEIQLMSLFQDSSGAWVAVLEVGDSRESAPQGTTIYVL